MSTKSSAVALGVIAAATVGAALLGSRRAGNTLWYRKLRKPAFTPPPKVFPIVWPILYTLQAASAYRVWRAPKSAERTKALVLWGVQIGLNAAWSPLFFREHEQTAALVDILGLDGALGAYVHSAAKVDRVAAWLAAPYLAWVGFATALNEEIVRLNR